MFIGVNSMLDWLNAPGKFINLDNLICLDNLENIATLYDYMDNCAEVDNLN